MVPAIMTLIADPRVLEIPIQENHEKVGNLLEAGLLIDARKNTRKEYYVARDTVINKLISVDETLPNGIQLLIIETFRPLSLQREYFFSYIGELRKLHPRRNERELYAEASKYVAPPEITPPHSTGGAVDLTLISVDTKKKLDMGTRINANPEESENACFTLASNISDEAKANRKILTDAMSKAGFVNYPTEWWHWSYGDRYWAYQTKAPSAIYGEVEYAGDIEE